MDHSMGSVAKEKQILFQEFQENLQSLSTCVWSLFGRYLDDFDTETFKTHEKLKMAFKYLLGGSPVCLLLCTVIVW